MSTDRGLTSALAAEVDTSDVRMILFAKLEFDSGDIFLHNGVGTYIFGGDTYLGVGDFGNISSIQEGTQLSPYEVDLVLSGIDASLFDEVLNQNYYLRPVTIRIGALNTAAGTLVDDPNQIWKGDMDTGTIRLGYQNSLIITCESEFATFERVNGAVFSDSDLQEKFPGDLFLEWTTSMEDVELKWGVGVVTTGRGAGKAGGGGGAGGSSGGEERQPEQRSEQ